MLLDSGPPLTGKSLELTPPWAFKQQSEEKNVKISREDVQHVAKLARLSFSNEDIELFTNQLNQILTYMDKLNELDTAHVEPTHHALAITNAFREDAIRPSVSNEKSLANAPAKADGSFTVPRVI